MAVPSFAHPNDGYAVLNGEVRELVRIGDDMKTYIVALGEFPGFEGFRLPEEVVSRR